jgi:hypothetical protein
MRQIAVVTRGDLGMREGTYVNRLSVLFGTSLLFDRDHVSTFSIEVCLVDRVRDRVD